MKKTTLLLVVAVALIAAALLWTRPAQSQQIPASAPTPSLDSRQQAWLGALEWCESRAEPGAINPKDKDNTPSYGILQFKPGTFASYAKLYGLGSTTDYMNPAEQEAIVTQMILRGGIDWHWQFPSCSRLLGLPPA